MKIDYSQYTTEELNKVRNSIDENVHPDKVAELDALLLKKGDSLKKLNQKEVQIEEGFYLCPECGFRLSQKVVNRLRYLVFGVRNSTCDKCNTKIQWTFDVRKKIRIFGYITNLGIITGFYALLVWIGVLPALSEHFHLLGTSLVAIGISGVISKTRGAKLENVNASKRKQKSN